MVDESRVEVFTVGNIDFCTTPFPNIGICYCHGTAYVEHPKFGVVAVRFTTGNSMDTFRPIKKREADFRAFVERCVKGIEEATKG